MHEDKTKEGFRLKLTQYLESSRCRKTPERYTIADIVYDAARSFDAEYVFEEARTRGITVSLATVYNTLALMISANMIRRINVNGRSCYEKDTAPSSYIHLCCTECGKVKDVKNAQLPELAAAKRFGKFSASYASVTIYGLCSSCVRAKRRAELKANILAREKRIQENRKKKIDTRK